MNDIDFITIDKSFIFTATQQQQRKKKKMKPDPIEFRAVTDLPGEEGWYYGREKNDPEKRIVPIKVFAFGNFLYAEGSGIGLVGGQLDSYDWFGAVREIREASTL